MAIPVATVKMTPVEAETFVAIGYAAAARQLYITFRNGTTLAYNNVPGFRFEGLSAAPRPEAYFKTFIRDVFISKPAQPPVQT
jgi:hypothetical protein